MDFTVASLTALIDVQVGASLTHQLLLFSQFNTEKPGSTARLRLDIRSANESFAFRKEGQ